MTLLPLDSMRAEMAYNALHFWQFQGTKGSSVVTSNCNTLVYEYAYQAVDAAGRSDIRTAITAAEERLGLYLGYDVAPRFREETLAFPRYFDSRYDRWGFAASDDRWLPVVLSWGRVQAIGIEQHTDIDLAAAITYSDGDTDTLIDRAVIGPLATTITDPDEIVLYVPASERLGQPRSERWRIAPLQVEISGGNVTITAPAWLFAKPSLYEGFDPHGIDINDATKRLTTVEVARRFCDPTGTTQETAQAVLVYETRPWPWYCLPSPTIANSADPAAVGYALARVGIRDGAAGVVSVGEAVYNTTTGQWVSPSCCGASRPPDRVLIRYLAGEDLEGGQMAARWRPIVARLAAAELPRRICACDTANRWLHEWQFDVSRVGVGQGAEQYAVSAAQLNNPFGTRRGHLFAYNQVKHLRQLGGMLAH